MISFLPTKMGWDGPPSWHLIAVIVGLVPHHWSSNTMSHNRPLRKPVALNTSYGSQAVRYRTDEVTKVEK